MTERDFGQRENIKSWSRKVQEIMDEMHNRSFCDYRPHRTWVPNVNVYETRTTYCVCVELAGLDVDSVRVECRDDQHICISGERTRPHSADLMDPFTIELMEIDEGPFERVLDFRQRVDVTEVRVLADKGHLWITLRKTTVSND